jgi:uncharacterized protein (TIGR03067 family)
MRRSAATLALSILLAAILLAATLSATEPNSQLALFQGNWEVVELVEDGKVIPKEAIREWLPSGGRVQIAENAIIFISPDDSKKHAKLFSIDVTRFPKGIEITSKDQHVSLGIYRFDGNRLVVCFSDPALALRPEEFSAPQGSKRMLMVLDRVDNSQVSLPPPPADASTADAPPSKVAANVLTDSQVRDMLVGTWQMNDGLGRIYATINANGTFQTTREMQEIRVFQTVFVRTPVSSGTWKVDNGQLTYYVSSSTHLERAGRTVALYVRSISASDVIFVDALGRVGTGVRVR